PTAVPTALVVVVAFVAVVGAGRRGRRGEGGPVAEAGDHLDELLRRHLAGVVADPGLVGGVVDRGLHAVEAVQLLLDPGGARGAGHALDLEVDGDRLGGGAVVVVGGGHDFTSRAMARLASSIFSVASCPAATASCTQW